MTTTVTRVVSSGNAWEPCSQGYFWQWKRRYTIFRRTVHKLPHLH